LTSANSAYGSHFYAAPEQARDFRNTPEQADIFALGCILHDAVDPEASRVPFNQIRVAGQYGPLLERCTDVQPKQRVQSVTALRAALFELWRTSQFTAPAPDQLGLIDAVINSPESTDAWRALIGNIEATDAALRDVVLRAISAELLITLGSINDDLFARATLLICDWASSRNFGWEYCDVVGDRLLDAYRIAPVRIKVSVVLAALELSTSHNRWHVLKQVGSMLSPAADNGLIDRLLIEIELDPEIEEKLRKIELVVSWARDRWHPKLSSLLTARD
jgi:eukaryotic-like serine/threonine-protein kinase